MNLIKPMKALGLTSVSSFDDVELSLISTDGVDVYEFLAHQKIPYGEELQERLRKLTENGLVLEENAELVLEIEQEVTAFYIEIIKDFMSEHGSEIDVIGIEGILLCHNPQACLTQQIVSPRKIAQTLGIKVVGNFHRADIISGGQGYPLTPSYYGALTAEVEKPAAVVNLSEISSITWFGSHGEMMAFDCGPANSAINEWVYKKAGMNMDYNGKLAITGKVDEKILATLMKHKYLALYPPKSMEKNIFAEKLEHLEGLSLEDGAATVTAFVAEAIAYSLLMFVPEVPDRIMLCGGGAKNPTLVRFVRQKLSDIRVLIPSEVEMNVDAIDAGCAAFLAVRRLNMLPISFPSTTGVSEPLIGGEVFEG
ncbi:MAG: anhydro-N-acetylmuramic acid kinase [Alphaproteobacteria bacterium]|nr:anhydro-N-acetylmuramic acid kinase [Alphaproteobacteria bacterium]